jgi:hypothetical protein
MTNHELTDGIPNVERGCVKDQPQHFRQFEGSTSYSCAAAGLRHSRAPKMIYKPSLAKWLVLVTSSFQNGFITID